MYGKLEDNVIIKAPDRISVNGVQIWNAPAELYLSLGWKPVIFTEHPEPEEGYYYKASWHETAKKITQTWTKTELPDEVSDSEALAAILEVLE